MSRTRSEHVAQEKGAERQNYMTSGELSRYLGISPRTFRRRRKAGTIPAPDGTTPAGWGLWSPTIQRALINREARL